MFRINDNRLHVIRTSPEKFLTAFENGFYMFDIFRRGTDKNSGKKCMGCEQPCCGQEKRSLCSVPIGRRCRVCAVGSGGVMRRRLMDLGLVPDAEITLLRAAPLNDPIEIRVGNAFVSLRRTEAEKIEVMTL